MASKSKINEVVESLKTQIEEGEYHAGQRLPSERALAEQLKVSRGTVRTALLRLQSDNLIDIIPRGGMFVKFQPAKVTVGDPLKNAGPELQNKGSFIHMARQQGRSVIIRYLEPSELIPAGEVVGEYLKIKEAEPVLRRHRVQLIDRVPYRILDTYLLGSLTSELVGQDDHKIPLFKWLKDQKNVTASRVSERLNSRMPTEKESSTLNISRNQPVIIMDRWIWGKDEKGEEILFEYSKITANASLHNFTYTYTIDESASK